MATEAQRKARNKYNKMNQMTKTIHFYQSTESDMIEHIEKLSMPFSTYVKNLIKEDMKK